MTDWPTPEEMAARIHDLMIRNHTALWPLERLAHGRPRARGTRRDQAWHMDASKRLNSAIARKKKPAQLVRVVVVDLATWREGHVRAAG